MKLAMPLIELWRMSTPSMLCLTILTIILLHVCKRSEVRRENRNALLGLLGSGIVAVLFDLLWGLSVLTYIQMPVSWLRVLSACHHISTGVLCYACFAYSETVQQSSYTHLRLGFITSFIPLVLLVILCTTSIWTEWVYHIDAAGSYRYGPFYWVFMLLAYNYPIFTSLTTYVRSLNKAHYAARATYRKLASFVIPLIIGAIAQEIFPTVPILCLGITVGALLVYISGLEDMISSDGLTELNNRTHLIRHISRCMRSLSKNESLFILMMDVDDFKHINDGFGHPEGDRALRVTSQVLQELLGVKKGIFLARYGGDEFTIVYETQNPAEVASLPDHLNQRLAKASEELQLPYVLHLSIGVAQYDGQQDLQSLIDEADKALYRVKPKKHRV